MSLKFNLGHFSLGNISSNPQDHIKNNSNSYSIELMAQSPSWTKQLSDNLTLWFSTFLPTSVTSEGHQTTCLPSPSVSMTDHGSDRNKMPLPPRVSGSPKGILLGNPFKIILFPLTDSALQYRELAYVQVGALISHLCGPICQQQLHFCSGVILESEGQLQFPTQELPLN